MNAMVTVPEAELRTALVFLAGADKILNPALAMLPGYQEATQAHAVLTMLLKDAVDGMPPDPVQGMDAAAIGHHEIMQSYQRAGFTDDQAWEATREYITATAMAAAANFTATP